MTGVEPVAPEIGVGPAAANVHAVGTAPPPLSFVTVFTNVRCAGWSLLLIVHVADVPSGNTSELPVNVPAVHDQAPGEYPAGPADSDNVYVPAFTWALVTGADPVVPEIGVGPAAASVHAAGRALPPLSFVTVFTSVRCAGWSSLLIVHVADVPTGNTNELPVNVPAVHDQAPGEYPAGPADSDNVYVPRVHRRVGHRRRPGRPRNRRRTSRRKGPRRRKCAAAVVVRHRLHQRQMRRLVVVDERAGALLPSGERDAGQGARERHHAGGAGDAGQRVSGHGRLGERVRLSRPDEDRLPRRRSRDGLRDQPGEGGRRRRGRGERPVAGQRVCRRCRW